MSKLDILKNGFGYVCFTYNDGSKKVFRTTLNTSLLLEANAYPKENELYDFDRKKMILLDGNVQIDISKDKPQLEEVHDFANLYIWPWSSKYT